MTNASEDIREIDLMAYADGLLEGDAARKAAVEAYMAANPAEAARVQAIIQDNQAIRELYAAELSRPLPKRLVRAVRGPARSRPHAPAAVAAGLTLALLAAGSGWLAGQHSNSAARASQGLLREMARHHVENSTQTSMGATISRTSNGALLSLPSDNVMVEIPLPDLSAQGFELADQQRIAVEGQEMVRLVYRSPDSTMNLFMRVRQDENRTRLRHMQAGNLAVHHWSSGPLAYALTVPAADSEAASITETVRRAVGRGRFVAPPPATLAGGEESIAGDGLLGVGQPTGPTPSPAPRSQFN